VIGMTDINTAARAGPSEDEEIDRLVLKGLGAPLEPAEAARLDALTASSPERAARAEGLMQAWMLAGVAGPETLAEGRASGVDRRWVLAAGLAGLTVSAGLWLARRPAPVIFQAPDTGPLKAQLADGTQVTLSRGGRMEARLDGRRRDVRLLAGEAFYAVAKDPARPFRVEARDHRLIVLGTRFNVDPSGADGLRVDLLEGSLQVEPIGGAAADRVVLKPGEAYQAGRTPRVGQADVDAAAAWIDGRLVFDDVALSQVALVIDRHTGQALTFADPKLARLHFSGVLRLDSAGDWKAALETVLPVRLDRTAGGYRLAAR
jgi:transmembrane sensor